MDPDGKYVAAASHRAPEPDEVVRVWEVEEGSGTSVVHPEPADARRRLGGGAGTEPDSRQVALAW